MEHQSVKVVTPEARASYAYVFRPRKGDDDDPGKEASYSIMLMFPKDSTDMSDMKASVLEAARSKWGDKALPGLKSGKLKNPIRDGATVGDKGLFDDFWVISARRKESFGPPGVVNEKAKRIVDQTEFYSGCWCYAQVTFFPFDAKGNRGVGCGLENLQKTRDDERLGGGTEPAEKVFKPLASSKSSGAGASDDDDYDF